MVADWLPYTPSPRMCTHIWVQGRRLLDWAWVAWVPVLLCCPSPMGAWDESPRSSAQPQYCGWQASPSHCRAPVTLPATPASSMFVSHSPARADLASPSGVLGATGRVPAPQHPLLSICPPRKPWSIAGTQPPPTPVPQDRAPASEGQDSGLGAGSPASSHNS